MVSERHQNEMDKINKSSDSPVGIIAGSAVAVVVCMIIVIIMVVIFFNRSESRYIAGTNEMLHMPVLE